MTLESQHFIQLSDITSVRFQCKHCNARIFLSLSRPMDIRKLLNCPNCGETWMHRANTQVPFDAFVAALKKLTDVMKELDSDEDKGFTLTLELATNLAPEG